MPDHAMQTLETLVHEGRRLLDASEPVKAHHAFREWDRSAGLWLDEEYPGSGLSAEWSALPNSRLVVANRYRDDSDSWAGFHRTVAGRLAWLGELARRRETKPPLESYPAENRDEPNGRSPGTGWEGLLHPTIRASALAQYRDGHWRDAVLNAFIAVFDLVRSRTALDLDGDRLATRVFSAEKPLLVVADLSTESGKDDQVGFMMVMQGVFRGIRNPKAHSLQHDLDALKSAQYLVMASLLARRVGEAQLRTDCGPT
jgi:uncharacterized protein (TIGR02391 family)